MQFSSKGAYSSCCKTNVLQVQYTDSSSARQLLARQGCGKIRHLSGKILWVQSKVQCGEALVTQVPTLYNLGDIGTKCLSRKRLFGLMGETGMFYVESQEPVGEAERLELGEHATNARSVNKLAKTIFRLALVMGLEPTTVVGQEEQCSKVEEPNTNFLATICLLLIILSWVIFLCDSVLVLETPRQAECTTMSFNKPIRTPSWAIRETCWTI